MTPTAPAGWLLLLVACTPPSVRYAVIAPDGVQGFSLLGDTLWNLPVDPKKGPFLVDQLELARERNAVAHPTVADQLLLARRTAAIGRLQEAIGILTRVAQVHFRDPRVFRLRGELLLRLRRFELARQDFRQAGTLLIGQDGIVDPIDLPGGEGVRLSTAQFQNWLLLSVTHYIEGDWVRARDGLIEAVRFAQNDDDLADAAVWLFFATRRIGTGAAASEVLRALGPDLQVDANRHAYDLLRAYKGEIPSDSIQARATARDGGDERSLYAYGVGLWHLVRNQPEEAELWFEQARAIPNWSALTYIAAEAELIRIRQP